MSWKHLVVDCADAGSGVTLSPRLHAKDVGVVDVASLVRLEADALARDRELLDRAQDLGHGVRAHGRFRERWESSATRSGIGSPS
jgi:hypothetical protein